LGRIRRLIFALVIAAAYKAKLATFMTFPSTTQVPTTWEQVVDSEFRVGLNMLGKGSWFTYQP